MKKDMKITTTSIRSTAEEPSATVISARESIDGKLGVPLDNTLLDAEFTRAGQDLIIRAQHEAPVVVNGYFRTSMENTPALLSETGKQIKAEAVHVLAGNPAANQFAGPAEGVAPIGSVEKLEGTVYVKHADGSETRLSEGDNVYQNDVIRTEDDGSIGIGFVDGSVFTLGNDARMTLDSMVYDPETGEGESSVTVIKGMFKFISGDIAANNPGDMVVETPVATIGIRGTTGGGNVVGPGQDNMFFLEPNADGTVGWFDVTTDAGTVSMNQPYMQVGIQNISAPPPPPSFTTQEALHQQFSKVINFTPAGRYQNRPESRQDGERQQQETQQQDTQGQNKPDASGEALPESSELLAPDVPQETITEPAPDAPTEEMQAGETAAEGADTEALTDNGSQTPEDVAMAGNDLFDGKPQEQIPPPTEAPTISRGDAERVQDPTKSVMEKFVSSGDVKQFISNTPITKDTGAANNRSSETHSGEPGNGHSLGQAIKEFVTQLPKSQGIDVPAIKQFFQQLHEQVRLGNLPPTAIQPDAPPVVVTPPTTTPPTTTPPPTTPPTTGGETPTTPPINGGGTGTVDPTIRALKADTVETLTGTAGNDTFATASWDNYINPSAATPNVPDIILGGAGYDKLQFLGHTTAFTPAMFNTSSSGVDALLFADPTITAMSLTLNDAMLAQTDSGTLSIFMGGIDLSTLDLSAITDETHEVALHGDNNNVTLTGGSGGTLSLHGTNMYVIGSGTGSYKIAAYEGDHTIDLGSHATSQHIALHIGSHTVTLGSGDDRVFIANGSHSVTTDDGNDSVLIDGGTGHTILLGAGENRIDVDNISSSSLVGGAGNDMFHLEDTTSVTVNGGAGNNDYDIMGAHTGLSVTGGAGEDRFHISGNGTMTLDGGFAAGVTNFYHLFDFSGTANITAYSAVSAGADRIELSKLGSTATVNLTLNTANGTGDKAELRLHGYEYDDYTVTASGTDVRIQDSTGAAVVLKGFFAGAKSYQLTTGYHDPFALATVGRDYQDIRELDATYAFSGVKLVANALTSTAGSNVITVTMAGHNFKTGDTITFNGIAAFDGLSTTDLNIAATITVIDANTFTYTALNNATSGMAGGGGTITTDFTLGLYRDIAAFTASTINGVTSQGYILGTGGNDTITAANDLHSTVIHGNDGDDTLTGAKYDILKGGRGNDTLMKLDGVTSVTMYGGDVNDYGFDIVDYSNQTNANGVDVDLGFNLQNNTSGTANFGDYLYGIEGVRGTAFADSLAGKAGAGVVNYFDGGAGDDVMSGGGSGAINLVDYRWTTIGLNISLSGTGGANVSHSEAGTDTLVRIQNIIGGSGNDSISGAGQNNVFYGNAGDDTLSGGAGIDMLIGGEGNDLLLMGAADNVRDTAVYEALNNGYDTIQEFHATAVTDATTALAQDVLDIASLVHNAGLIRMDFFDLIRENRLSLVQNGADTDVKFDLDGAGAGGLGTIATLTGVTASNLDWKHFITSHESTYIIDGSGSSTEHNDDKIIATTAGTYYGYDGDDLFERVSGSVSFDGGDGDDIFIINTASELSGDITIEGGEGLDTLLLDTATLDFSAITIGNIANIEALDLYGNAITNLDAQDVFDLTAAHHNLFVLSSKAGASLSLSGSWQMVDNTELGNIPNLPGFDNDASYTTYVSDYSGTDVYVHVNNQIAA